MFAETKFVLGRIIGGDRGSLLVNVDRLIGSCCVAALSPIDRGRKDCLRTIRIEAATFSAQTNIGALPSPSRSGGAAAVGLAAAAPAFDAESLAHTRAK